MKINPKKIKVLIEEIERILIDLSDTEKDYELHLNKIHPSFKKSAINLIHYRKLRSKDIRRLQKKLGDLGISRIARAEPHIFASLNNCLFILKMLLKQNQGANIEDIVTIKKAQKKINKHTKDLLGYKSEGRRVRIMVTLPSEAAYNYQLIKDLVKSGMNTARINCAHDTPQEWVRMIENLEKAKRELGKNCKVSMDLAGPKIRTGAIAPGPQVRRFRPTRNKFGQVVEWAEVYLVTQLSEGTFNELAIDEAWLKTLKKGDKITLVDTRNKNRTFTVKEKLEDKVLAICKDTCYIGTGTEIINLSSGLVTSVLELPPIEQALFLKNGDRLRIIKEPKPGKAAQFNEDGGISELAFISCTSKQIFEYVKAGEKILFDDGKITGVVKANSGKELEVEIIHAKAKGAYLKADKGINFPETDLRIKGLTQKDREDLKFIAAYADVVNFSFVNTPEDVEELLLELQKLGVANKLGIILKIETQSAYNNLTEILLAGMQNYPLGVMIARGDLAIESGWENMARIQQEILSLCNAAHVPDVWATQVLESLAKKGIPSRSEITDAATSLNAECVMLNKGVYIRKAVELLDYILKSLSKYRDKNVRMLPKMEEANQN